MTKKKISYLFSLFFGGASKIDSVDEYPIEKVVVDGVVEKSVEKSANFVVVDKSAKLVGEKLVEDPWNNELEKSANELSEKSINGFGVEATVINVDRVSEILEKMTKVVFMVETSNAAFSVE